MRGGGGGEEKSREGVAGHTSVEANLTRVGEGSEAGHLDISGRYRSPCADNVPVSVVPHACRPYRVRRQTLAEPKHMRGRGQASQATILFALAEPRARLLQIDVKGT